MDYGKLNPYNGAKISFPGFQEILDFTSAGSESSVSVTVDGDTDKEYLIYTRNLNSGAKIGFRFNSDSGNNYGYQFLNNSSGTITANRSYDSGTSAITNTLGEQLWRVLTPTGFIKTMFSESCVYSSGTTISQMTFVGWSWNSTANVTSIDFFSASGNFGTGTRICVYARRAQ